MGEQLISCRGGSPVHRRETIDPHGLSRNDKSQGGELFTAYYRACCHTESEEEPVDGVWSLQRYTYLSRLSVRCTAQSAMQHLLDVSDLPPPEPLERVLDALADLPAGDSLKVRLPMEPVLLYSMLRSMGLAWEHNSSPGGAVELVIWEPLA
jgi:hypothetical protein